MISLSFISVEKVYLSNTNYCIGPYSCQDLPSAYLCNTTQYIGPYLLFEFRVHSKAVSTLDRISYLNFGFIQKAVSTLDRISFKDFVSQIFPMVHIRAFFDLPASVGWGSDPNRRRARSYR